MRYLSSLNLLGFSFLVTGLLFWDTIFEMKSLSDVTRKIPEDEVMKLLNEEIDDLFVLGATLGLSEEEIENCMNKAFECGPENVSDDDTANNTISSTRLREVAFIFSRIIICTVFFILLALSVGICIVSFKPAEKFVIRYGQGYVYPVMRFLRIATLPIIRNHEYLTQWHEEECLMTNPLYREPPIDCWSCEDVRTVVDLTYHANLTVPYHDRGAPFVIHDAILNEETVGKSVTFSTLRDAYIKNSHALEKGTARLSSHVGNIQNLQELFSLKSVSQREHIEWHIKRVSAVQIIRTIFKRPYFIPKAAEVALQRFIYIDGPQFSSYELPLLDFANVWIAQGSGYRRILLHPSKPCEQRCHSVSILLKAGDILYYNWQFYRATTTAAKLSNDLSITLMSSFY